MHMICRISQIKCVLTTCLVHKCAFFKNVPFIEFYLHNFKFSCTYIYDYESVVIVDPQSYLKETISKVKYPQTTNSTRLPKFRLFLHIPPDCYYLFCPVCKGHRVVDIVMQWQRKIE